MLNVLLLLSAVFQLGTHRVACAADRFPDTPAGRLIAANRTLVIGHRGCASQAPENTLFSFQAAIKAGADVVELDTMVTRDGRIVAFHDDNLDRTTDARKLFGRRGLKVADVNYQVLTRLDAGSWFNHRYAGAKVPTLSDSLDLIQKERVTMIERKVGDAAPLVQLLKDKQLLDQVLIQSFDWKFIAEVHRLAPQVVIGALGKDRLTRAKLSAIQKTGAQLVVWNAAITRSNVEAIHAADMKVWVYTVNSSSVARKLISTGVDGIITDNPADMVELRNALPRR